MPLSSAQEINLESVGFQDVNAASIALDGFVVREDLMTLMRSYIRNKTILWPLLRKEQAEGDTVQEFTEAHQPASTFFSKIALNPIENPSNMPAMLDSARPPQEVKAGGGLIKFGHYARSLYNQQNKPFGDIVAKKTADLIASTAKTLERALVLGNATANPLEFNGLANQLLPDHVFRASKISGDMVYKKLRSLARVALNDSDITREITHILTTSLGVELLTDEMDAKLQYVNLNEVRPGLTVPGLIIQGDSQGGFTPIITSPYLKDQMGDGAPDIVTYWLLDMNSLCWKGVYPEGGQRTFDPQIFEVSQFTSDSTPYLLEKRMCLFYGTLYASNSAQGIWRLDVEVPAGTIGSI